MIVAMIKLTPKIRAWRKINEETVINIYKKIQLISDPMPIELLGVMTVYETVWDHFAFDGMPERREYRQWLDEVMDFIDITAPWYWVVKHNNRVMGALWASHWDLIGQQEHAVQIGAFMEPGINPAVTQAATYNLINALFDKTPVQIVRAESAESNRAARLASYRCGLRSPETRRCWRIKDGEPVTGIIVSVTRQEWDDLHEQRIQLDGNTIDTSPEEQRQTAESA